MKNIGNKATIFIYIILLINIILIVGYIVLNNVFILNNNINIGKNAEEVFSSVHDKGNINIETVRRYNSNGDGYLDGLSCPTNITMEGDTNSGSVLFSQMVYDLGSIYCQGYYNSDEFRIYFDKDFSDFKKAYYKGDVVDIVKSVNTNITTGTTNIALSSAITGRSPYYNGHIPIRSADSSISTYSESEKKRGGGEYLKYHFGSDKSIGEIVIKKKAHYNWNDSNKRRHKKYWKKGYIYFYDSSGTRVHLTSINNMRTNTSETIDFKHRGLTNDVRTVEIEVYGKYLDVKEFEIYELESTGSEEIWEGDRDFNDSDNTLISFDSTGIGGGDNFDDDFNSDNYRVTSIDDVYYANGFQDDDVVPRLTIFGSIPKTDRYYNVFWNNYKTNDFIDKNPNNDDIINKKIGDISQAYLYIDLFNEDGNIDYDMKILEFDPNAYKNQFTLLPVNTAEGKYLTDSVGYIQNNGGVLSLSETKTGNEYEFDFQNKDYAVFLTNEIDGKMSYRITGETLTGEYIYINPINDSNTGTIESLSNHIIIGGEKNFIGEDFIIIGDK